VVINADRDQMLARLEDDRLAGALTCHRAADWVEPGHAAITARRSIVEAAGGAVGPDLRRFTSSEHYVPWRHPDHPTLAALLVHYLRLLGADATAPAGDACGTV
jgi:hypothetical protein